MTPQLLSEITTRLGFVEGVLIGLTCTHLVGGKLDAVDKAIAQVGEVCEMLRADVFDGAPADLARELAECRAERDRLREACELAADRLERLNGDVHPEVWADCLPVIKALNEALAPAPPAVPRPPMLLAKLKGRRKLFWLIPRKAQGVTFWSRTDVSWDAGYRAREIREIDRANSDAEAVALYDQETR